MQNENHPLARRHEGKPPAPSGARTYLEPRTAGGPGYDMPLDAGKALGFLRRRKWIILAGFVPVMIFAIAVTLLLPKTYEASASFLVEQRNPVNSDALALLDRLGDVASRRTEIELIRSRRVVEPAVESGSLHVTVEGPHGRVPPGELFQWFQSGPSAVPGEYELSSSADSQLTVRDLKSGATVATAGPDESIEFANVSGLTKGAGLGVGKYRMKIIPFSEAVVQTTKRLEVSVVDRDADVVALRCSGRTPAEAQWLCDAVSDSYLSLRSELQQAEATAAADFLSDQTDLVAQRLKLAEDSLSDYTRRSHAVALDIRAAEQVRQNAAMWAQRESLKAEEAALGTLIDQIESDDTRGGRKYRDLAAFPTFLKSQNQMVTTLLTNLVELENRRNDLALRRSDKDVELAALNDRVADVEQQLKAIATGYRQALNAQIESMDAALRNSGNVLASIPAQQIETARLERQVSLLEDLYRFLQTHRQEAEIAKAVDLPSVRVVDKASLPFRPSSPNAPLNIGLGFILALSFGFMLGLWKEQTDTRVREPSGVEEATGIPVLSLLPGLGRPGPVISIRLPASNGHLSTALTPAWTTERELALEAFRTLNADLGFFGREMRNGGLRSVAITSPAQGEGKTFTACNLAIVRASHGTQAILIDADLRGRGVSRFLGLPSSGVGLTEVLTDEVELNDAIQRIEIGAGNTMHVLPAGSHTSRSAELLESERFRELLAELMSRFELVVVDTPPLNVVTDAAAVAAGVDGVVVVVRGGHTDRSALHVTLSRLERAGAKTAGIVLNDVELPPHYRTYSHEA
ncbi:MAG: polysaccharide biosynthesis tyrosine autokinase [Candidatus Palauibacterales bacterium]|nr:polysaccharide biosynthesis tyrosine autokinase [Candidatus Palauibacterales bacterium]